LRNSDLGTGGDFNSQETTVLREAPFDIPVVNEDGATPIQRVVRVKKPANFGSAGSGFYAQLFPTDLSGYVQLTTSGVKIMKITSYSLGSEESIVAFQRRQTTNCWVLVHPTTLGLVQDSAG